MIAKIYKGDSNAHNSVYDNIKANSKIESSGVSFSQALMSPEYRNATWICFILAIFN